MKKVSANKYRIVEHYTAAWGTQYTVEELFVDKKGRETWSVWGSGGYDCEYYSCSEYEVKTVIEAGEKIGNVKRVLGLDPRGVKEMDVMTEGGKE